MIGSLWTVYIDGTIIDHPYFYDSGYVVNDIKIDLEINAHGAATFTVPPNNPAYDAANKLGAIVVVMHGDEEVFRGRVSEITMGFHNELDVYCEGQLAFLCDSMLQPFSYKGSVKDFLQFIINTHNTCVSEERRFSLGTVTVTDKDNNGVLVRSSESSISCWEAISSRLLDMLGGYLLLRKSGNVYYIDYLADLTTTCAQAITYGENLLDIDGHIDMEDIVTVLYPFGAQIEEDGTNENTYDKYMEEPQENGMTLWHGNRVTVREVNNGVMYVENQAGIKTWGRIYGTKVWDDVTIPANLLSKANSWLASAATIPETMTVTAVDLSLVDAGVDEIHIGELVRVSSPLHGVKAEMPCTKMHIEPGAPDNCTLTLGIEVLALSQEVANMKNGKYGGD